MDERISFERNNVQFDHRVAGVALHDGHVLLHRAECDDFWALPGGRCEMMEPSTAALRREMAEEMGADVRVVRLLWVVENFFELNGLAHHELGLYFLIHLGPRFRYDITHTFYGDEGGLRLIFCWFPARELEAVRLYPSFLRTALQSIPQATQHVVHTDAK